MPQNSSSFVYAKKIRLPDKSAHILQSLNMALAFGASGTEVSFFPGIKNSEKGKHQDLVLALQALGKKGPPPTWEILSGRNKGFYGMMFRLKLLQRALRSSKTIFYARDVAEGAYLATQQSFLQRIFIFEAHEVLFQMRKAAGKTNWEKTKKQEFRIAKAINGLVTTGEQVANDFSNQLDYAGPVLVEPNGFNPELFYPVSLFSGDFPWPDATQNVVAVYVGNFHDGKGVDVLIEAYRHLPERFCLRVIGGNPEKEWQLLQQQAAAILGGKKRIQFLGAIPQSKIYDACRGAHMAVLPQQSEYFFSPLKMYESFALGLPLVATPLAMFQKERDKGMVYAAQSPQPKDIAEAIKSLANSPNLALQLREKGFCVAQHHTWEARAQRILAFAGQLRK